MSYRDKSSATKTFTHTVMASLSITAVAGCASGCESESSEVPHKQPSAVATPPLTYETAHRELPINGTKESPLIWQYLPTKETEEMLSARRYMAFQHWMFGARDKRPTFRVVKFLTTREYFKRRFADSGSPNPDNDAQRGPVWIRILNLERVGPNGARALFCSDIGWWHAPSADNSKPAEDRADLFMIRMKYATGLDGQNRWLVDGLGPDPEPKEKEEFQAKCDKWAQHKKP